MWSRSTGWPCEREKVHRMRLIAARGEVGGIRPALYRLMKYISDAHSESLEAFVLHRTRGTLSERGKAAIAEYDNIQKLE